MAKINDLSQGNLSQIWDAIRKLQYATSQNNMAIGRGGLTVYGGGGIVIENGGLYVTGSATISGLLEVAGTINMTGIFTATGTVRLSGQTDIWGPLVVTGDTDLDGLTTINGDTTLTGLFTVTGDTTVTGDFNVQGPMKTTGTLSVEGVTTLKNDLNVTTGKVKVGSAMTLDPTVSSGALVFSNGAQIFTDGTTVQMYKGTSAVTVADGTATLQGNGSNYVRADSSGIRADGPLRATSTLKVDVLNTAPAGKTANVYWDPADHVFKFIP